MPENLSTSRALIVISGLPGSGKSEVARVLSSRLGIPVFAKDHLEAVLVRSELATLEHDRLGYSGYELLTHCAEALLAVGKSVALDSVCGFQRIRDGWRKLAEKHEAAFVAIECICSDTKLHQERIRSRNRSIPGWPELRWDDVLKVSSYYQPWTEERLEIDSCEPISAIEETIVKRFSNARA